MSLPTISLRVGWAAKIKDALSTIVWENLNSTVGLYLRGGSTGMGRQRQLDRIEPGRASFTFADPDHTLDPANPDSPFAGRMRALARLQFRVVWNGVTYPLFTGFLRRVVFSRSDLDSRLATMECVDHSTVLNQTPTPASAFAVEVAKDRPIHWWKFGADTKTRAVSDSGTQPSPLISSYITSGQPLAAGDRGTSGTFDGEAVAAGTTAALTGPPWVIEVPFVADPDGDLALTNRTLFTQTSSIWIGVLGSVDPAIAQRLTVLLFNRVTGAWAAMVSAKRIADGLTHLAALAFDGALMNLYIDGALSAATPAANQYPGGMVVIGANDAASPPTGAWKGQIGDVVIFKPAISGARLAAHWTAFNTGWSGDQPGARAARLLDIAAIPAADRSLGNGVCRLGPAVLGQSVLAQLSGVADSDGGVFYGKGDGTVVYLGREYQINNALSTTSQATFSDISGVAYDLPLELPIDDQYLWNQAVVTREGGAAQTVNDLVAQDRDGIRPVTRSGLEYASDDESLAEGHRLLRRRGPQSCLNNISIRPQRDPVTLYVAALNRQMWDRVTWEHRPGQFTFSEDLIVQGIAHEFTVGAEPSWTTNLSVSPADPLAPDGYFAIGNAARGLGTGVLV